MRLENELYKLVDRDDRSARVRLLPDSVIFKAHFPGNPVTPGVCQVGMVEELAEMILDCKLHLREVKSLKYLEVLRPQPDQIVVISFDNLAPEDAELKVKGSIAAEDKMVTKFSLVFVKQ